MASTRGRIENLQLATAVVPIVGVTPLIIHRFSEKAAAMMLGKHMGEASAGRDKKVPELEFIRCLHLLPDGTGFGFPSVGLKSAAVRGADITEMMKMTQAKGAMRVDGVLVPIFGIPQIDVAAARNHNTMDIRIRPRFDEWAAFVPVTFNTRKVSLEQVIQLFEAGGFGNGIGDWRMEKDGVNGSFRVGQVAEVEDIRDRTAEGTVAFLEEYAPYVDTVRQERTSLWALIEKEEPEEQMPDEARRIADPKSKKNGKAGVHA